MDGQNVLSWLHATVNCLRRYTDLPLVVRGHPGNMNALTEIKSQITGVTISTESDLRRDLDASWATVTYNSSPGVASVLWGVPTFVTDSNPQRSQAWPVVNTDLSRIMSPTMPDRESFYHRLAQCHWNTGQLSSGAAWRFFKDRLPVRH